MRITDCGQGSLGKNEDDATENNWAGSEGKPSSNTDDFLEEMTSELRPEW